MWTPSLLHPHQPGPRDGDGYEWQSQREPNFEANLSCETNEGEFGEKERGEDQHRVVVQKSGKKKASAKASSRDKGSSKDYINAKRRDENLRRAPELAAACCPATFQ